MLAALGITAAAPTPPLPTQQQRGDETPRNPTKDDDERDRELAALKAENVALRRELAKTKKDLARYEEAPASEPEEVMAAEKHRIAKLEEAAQSSSASAAALALAPDVSLEFTRDSPMFRRSCEAYEEAMDGLDVMLKEFAVLCRKWTAAQARADEVGKEAARWMRDKRHGRALFSGALAVLGEAAEITTSFADHIDDVISQRGQLAFSMEELANSATKFRVEEMGDVAGFREEVWGLGDDYEAKLVERIFLKPTSKISQEDDVAATQVAREKFEIARFGLVRHLNFLDAQKKLALVELFGVAGPRAIEDYFAQGLATIRAKRRSSGGDPSRRLAIARQRACVDEKLWLKILDRLQAELRGELPPPGAPRGARAVAPPRQLDAPPDLASTSRNPTLGAPPWSAALTTEVLASASLAASRADLAHARDEGVLKQGYLYRRDLDGLASLLRGIATKPKRKWYRLHNGALYVVDAIGDGESKLCDLRGCAVHRGASDRFAMSRMRRNNAEKKDTQQDTVRGSEDTGWTWSFILVRPDGHRLAFQADNDDELLKWISALRRSTKWRDLKASTNYLLQRKRDPPFDDMDVDRDCAVDQGNADLIATFVRANPRCAECGKPDVEWVATAVGCTLCTDCAAIHRKLGSEFAKLRALWLDKWSSSMLRYLIRAAGNAKVNAVWEAMPPEGWIKPTPEAPVHERLDWIVAKYIWYGFIGDEHRGATQHAENDHFEEDDDDDDHGQRKGNALDAASLDLATAARYNDVQGLMRAYTRRGSPTWRDVNNRSRSALHVATLAGNVDAVAFLLLNGGDPHQLDDDDATPLSLASTSDSAVQVASLILESEQGEFW